ncbi:aminotransferase class I/II-fold pyridoxal phosphate-dependent enzyme [[Clostridium] saccharogumia]|uniref:aminotransferase class I/II-fold pyridoxal phosphate-dependent enzyme n=1 Tax=Thomasclavelia saccharogumia TaxID=341225 RepID=UPI001D071A49|nr:aminotransferase class I/II-fold pyridoxal phosphate-dependent enzyme [Thomasclavelia saccharogumia]MCB6707509.1 aminotransferase class I/II-fold pyridoxal phosphate-dependent enzyme [Thomasclavelia saccharogumia]
MKPFTKMNKNELLDLKKVLDQRYQDFKSQNLKLDMSRGKPCKEQLDLSMSILDMKDYSVDGIDCRNYGVLEGLPSLRKLFAQLLEVNENNVIIGGTSSLTLMYDYIAQAMLFGVCGSKPWSKYDKIKFLCPVPGYDRHFAFCEFFGIEMVNVPMTEEGPDIDIINELIKDDRIKGMFCVPKYSNPQGITYSDKIVKALASLKPAADDFRIIYDNAYCVHDLNEPGDTLLNIFDELPLHNNEDLVIMVASTSKITFAGGGVSCLVASDNNILDIKKRLFYQSISQDKMNQLRHLKFFNDVDSIKAHMKKQAAILKPKFDCAISHLNNELANKGIASWHEPNGGYFISLDVMPGCAKRVGQLCKEAGVVLTTIGATFPYGNDPQDSNIRIAPSFPTIDELSQAATLLCICVQIAAIEQLTINN